MEDDLTFPQIIHGLSAPIASTTADGRVDLVNTQLLNYLGMSFEELKDWETSGAVILTTCPGSSPHGSRPPSPTGLRFRLRIKSAPSASDLLDSAWYDQSHRDSNE